MNAIMNKTNNRLIVAVAALVLLMAGLVVVATADSSNADSYAETSPLSFSGDISYDDYGETSNVAMKNSISVAYDKTTGTYTFYGYLAQQDLTDTDSTFYKLWTENTDSAYGIAFTVAGSSGTTIQVGNGTVNTMTDDSEECLLYLDGKTETSTVKIGDVTYTLDLGGLNYITLNELEQKQIIDGSTITSDATIDLTKDAYLVSTITATTGNIVVNLNGHNLMTGVRILNADTDSDATTVSLTINAGEGGSITAAYDIVYANSTGKLTVNGGNYTSDEYAFIWGGATVTESSTTSAEIRDATIDAYVGIWLSYGTFDNAIIDNCTINATFGVYLGTFNDEAGDGATVSNTTINAVETAVEIKSGNVTIDNCNLSSETYVATDGTIGMSQSGSGVDTVCINNGYTSSGSATEVNVTISDSTITNSATDAPVQVLVGNKQGSTTTTASGSITLTSNCLDATQVEVGYTSESIAAENTITLVLNGETATTVKDESEITAALGEESVDSIIYAGTTIGTGTAPEITKPIVFKNLDDSENAITLSGDGTAAVDGTIGKLTITTTKTVGNDKVTDTATITDVTGSFIITVGSITIEGQADPIENGNSDVNIDGDAEVVGTFTLSKGVTFTFASGSLTIPSGAILNINGDMTVPSGVTVTNNGTINVTGSITIDEGATFTNNGQIYTSSSTNIKGDGTVKGNSVTEGLGLSNNMDAIASDLPLSGYAYLTSDLTIPASKSISVNAGATLDLRGYTLTVLGTLNVASNGTVINAGSTGGIVIGTNGVINNSGILGSTNAPVTVSLADGEDGSVTLANVNGLSFGYKRVVVGTNNVDYYLAISGDATKRGQDNGSITVSGTVYVNDALTVGSKVDMTIDGKLVLDNGVRFTVSSSGTASGSGSVVLGVGSVVDIDGYADITVSAPTGDYKASEGAGSLNDSSIDIANVKGIEVTVTSESYSDNGVLMMKQRLDISGAMDDADAKKGNATVEFTGDHITVTGTLTVNKDIKSWTNSGTITVTGTVSWGDDMAYGVNILSGYINGAHYQVQTTVEGVPSITNYITSFQAAVENIANAYEQTVTAYGTVDVDFDFTIGADQTVEGDATYDIDKDATVTVANDGYFEASAVSVEGRLVVYVNGVIQFTPEYSVKSVDAEYTTTYSGFAAALEDAQPGQTITVEKNTYVDESVTIPEGVTVVVSNGASLNVGYEDASTKADNTADLIVNGTLNVIGSVNVNGDVDIAGTADVTEATGFDITDTANEGEITVTGTLTTINAISETINAFQYTNLDQEIVYTNLAAAAEVVNGYDVNKIIDQVGTVSDSAAVTLTGVTLNINGVARLGTITLDESSIVVGESADVTKVAFTGTVAGLSGEEGSTVTTTASFTGVNCVTIANTVAPNDANVDVHTTYIAINDDADVAGTPASVTGAVSVDAGVLEVRTMTFAGDKNTLTVASGAEAAIANGNTLTAAGSKDKVSVTVDGTMTVNGTLKVTGVMDVNGTLDVAKAERNDAATVTIGADTPAVNIGVLNVAGDLNISGEQDLEGTLNVNGVLAVSGTVTGAVNKIDGVGYIKAYAGADLADAEILIDENTSESLAKVTAFHINGALYMTVYAAEAPANELTYGAVLGAEEFSVPGYDVSDLKELIVGDGTAASPYQSVWFKDADLTQAVATANSPNTDPVIGADENLYSKVSALNVEVRVSVGTGISLYIDDVRITDNTVTLSVGTHTVSAIVDPGYTGTVTISFNGATVSGSFEITSDMASAAYEGTPAISATGNISVAGGSSSGTTTGGDDGMGLTDYLLIILVILIVVMAIIVAMRLMRS